MTPDKAQDYSLGGWTPRVHREVPQQVWRRYVVLLLKGCQTRSYDELDDVQLQCAGFTENNMPFRAFIYDDSIKCYVDWVPEVTQ